MSAKLEKLISTALRDGRVKAAEVAALTQQARADSKSAVLTSTDVARLAKLLQQHTDAFDSQARTALRSLLAAQTGADAADPGVMLAADPGTTYTSVSGGKLYVDGLSYDDLVQGEAGDCYYLASLAAVAETRPDVLKKAIHYDGDGTYTVRFYDAAKDGTAKPVEVTVDGDFPTSGDAYLYASSRRSKELWGPLLEKAYAKWKGGYEEIGEGGYASDALFALTGKASSYVSDLSAVSSDELFAALKIATQAGDPMVTGTYSTETRSDLDYEALGLHDSHAYTLLGVSEQNGQRTVTLRDPHGGSQGDPLGTYSSEDGTFTLPYEQYLKCFQDLDVLQA